MLYYHNAAPLKRNTSASFHQRKRLARPKQEREKRKNSIKIKKKNAKDK